MLIVMIKAWWWEVVMFMIVHQSFNFHWELITVWEPEARKSAQ